MNIQQARKLCTAPELKLFEASRPPLLKQHTSLKLQALIKRARTQRDKFGDLLKRQRLALRASTGSKKTGLQDSNQRTTAKVQMFEQVLRDLQAQLTKLKDAAKLLAQKEAARKAKAKPKTKAKSKAKPLVKSKSKARSKSSARAGSLDNKGFLSAGAVGADIRQRGQKTRAKAVMGHKRAAGRRSQARRDSRN
jgi:hypothetical protein